MRLNCNMWQVLFNTHMLKYCKTSVNEVLWGEERSNKDKFLPQGSIEHHKKQKTTRWTVAADCSEHWLEPIQRIQSQGQRRHQSCMILLCLGRSAERTSWGYLKSRNHRKNLLRCKDNFKKIEERTRKQKKTRTASVRCGMSWQRGAVGSLFWSGPFPAGLIDCRWPNKTSCFETG